MDLFDTVSAALSSLSALPIYFSVLVACPDFAFLFLTSE